MFLENVIKKYRSYRGTIVGFLGVVGSGKSSLINALLGEEELLTTSSDRAATAVVCEVEYNHESSDYRAEIVYRSRESLTEQLDKLFDNLKFKSELELRKKALEENPSDDDPKYSEREEIDDQIMEIQANISETIEAVFIVWGLSGDDLKDMSTQVLLDDKSYGPEYLGKIRQVSGTDREAFADEISQYLTSTSEDLTGLGLPPWPLIEKVILYVKSDLLKYGLRIRDVPGMCDAVEGRANIARRNSKDLGITVIVAPAIRASDEKTAVGLIEQQHLGFTEMKMDGKFDHGSFCVVLSKTDDIKSEPYLRKVAKADKSIESQLRRVRELDRAFNSARSRKRKFGNEMPEHDASVPSNSAELEKNRREATAIKERLEQIAVFMRNRDITERIQPKFQKRYRDIDLTEQAETHAEEVEVFGISSKAYWMSKHPDGIKAKGFPDEKTFRNSSVQTVAVRGYLQPPREASS